MAKITINGLMRNDPDLFVGIRLPEGLDRDSIISMIRLECGNLELMYPDAEFMREAIAFWSQARLHTWERYYRVLYEEYDPFVNIKRDEHRTITQTRDLQGTSTSTDSIAAWNESQPTERQKSSGSGTDTGTVTTDEVFHVEGDSAITDAQDVVRNEIKVRMDYDLFRIIEDEFRKQFCLLVY